jgi:hypothetical protein
MMLTVMTSRQSLLFNLQVWGFEKVCRTCKKEQETENAWKGSQPITPCGFEKVTRRDF